MNINEAIKTLDGVIPSSDNKMVDFEHLPIAIAWETVKAEIEYKTEAIRNAVKISKEGEKELIKIRNETAKEILNDLYFNLQSSVKGHIAKSNVYYNVMNRIQEIAKEYGVEIPHGVKKGVKRIENRYF